jgi:uroporphyrinogen decarboxylase
MRTIIDILINKDSSCQSIWFMRQAGRYLPEFKEIRLQNQNFIDLCLNSELSSKITLQPIKRYDLDSAIIFSDILLIPYALGQKVQFIKDQGPILSEININKFLNNTEIEFTKKLESIYKSIKKTRENLEKEKSLISFVGAPWTLLVYMLGLKKNKNKIDLFKFKKNKNNINKILNKLIDYSCLHIESQIQAGADLVQIFDSWAGLIPNDYLEDLCYKPNLKIVNFCKEKKIPVICFPKGIRENYLSFQNIVKPNGLNLDYDVDPLWARENLTKVALQGGMHPSILLKPDEQIYSEAKRYLDIFKDVPYIFNLGHGIVPETEPDKLGKLIKFVRNYK